MRLSVADSVEIMNIAYELLNRLFATHWQNSQMTWIKTYLMNNYIIDLILDQSPLDLDLNLIQVLVWRMLTNVILRERYTGEFSPIVNWRCIFRLWFWPESLIRQSKFKKE
jgi:hypothetical protein